MYCWFAVWEFCATFEWECLCLGREASMKGDVAVCGYLRVWMSSGSKYLYVYVYKENIKILFCTLVVSTNPKNRQMNNLLSL